MIHRWLARLPASLIYLRDATRTHYLQGVQSLAPTRGRPALAQQVGKVDNRADCNRITASLFRGDHLHVLAGVIFEPGLCRVGDSVENSTQISSVGHTRMRIAKMAYSMLHNIALA